MKKVLITGACGYLGARLSKFLAEKGHKITAFDSYDSSTHNEWESLMDEVIVGDIRDETVISNLTGKNFDVAIQLISLDHYKSENNPNFVSTINVMPTWNLLDSLTRNGLEKFIYFSTIHVYGNLPNGNITEDHQPNPVNAYGLTHFLSENICNYFNNKTDTECINVRLSNSYGGPIFNENNCWWLVINNLCKTAKENNEIKLKSDGSPQRDFIHIHDICRAIEVLIESERNFKENIFNVASGKTYTILELAHVVQSKFNERYGKDIPILLPDKTLSKDPRKFKNIERFLIDTSRIKKLGFQQPTSLQTGLDEIFDYLENKSG